MEVREVKTVEILVVTSDRGLCGSFNANIIKTVEKIAKQYEADGKKVSFVTVGKKGTQVFKKTGKIEGFISMISWAPSRCSTLVKSPRALQKNFMAGESDQVRHRLW